MGATAALGAGFYSIIRYRPHPARDDARTVAVVLVDDNAGLGWIRSAPISSISEKLAAQGTLDRMLLGLEQKLQQPGEVTRHTLLQWSREYEDSISVSEPMPAFIGEQPAESLRALYRALVQPPGRPRNQFSRGSILDRAVKQLRAHGADVRRGEYLDEFIFDAIISSRDERPTALAILSFATLARDWSAVEREARSYLFAIERVDARPFGIIQPPVVDAVESRQAHARVVKWMTEFHVPTSEPSEIDSVAKNFGPVQQQELALTPV